jgi:predicted O-methyltransferase YrrM
MKDLINYTSLVHKNALVNQHLKVPKSLSWPYLKYRILRPIIKFHYRTYRKLNAPVPWISPAAIAILNKWLTADMRIFEWGSGASTVYFARKVQEVVSVEHNSAWYDIVLQLLNKEKVTEKVSLNYFEIDKRSDSPYQAYADFILTFPDQHFDLILIDGRARVACTKNAVSKLKPGGLLVLDNAERSHYREAKQLLQGWPQLETTTGLQNTTLYQKPA